MPVGFMSGIVGRFMRSFGLTMAFAIMVSMLVSFTLTPMLSSRFLRLSDALADHKTKEEGFFHWLDTWYARSEDDVLMYGRGRESGSHHVSHHVIQKVTGHDVEAPSRLPARPRRTRDPAHRPRLGAARGAKRGTVVSPLERPGRPREALGVGSLWRVPREAPEQDVVARDQQIAIAPAQRLEAGIELGCDLGRFAALNETT